MRNVTVGVVIGGLVAAATFSSTGARQPVDPVDPVDQAVDQILAAGGQVAPKAAAPEAKSPTGPNPYLALVPDPATIDVSGWSRYVRTQSVQRADRRRQAASPILVDEDEPVGVRGANDTLETAQPINGFGTRRNQNAQLRILGTLSPAPVSVEPVAPNEEDDGSIPLAGETGIGVERDGITTSAEIGDGPHGRAGTGSGDFDLYVVDALEAEQLVVDIDTPAGGELDSIVVLYDADGNIVALNDDNLVAGELDSLLQHRILADGRYYVLVGAWDSFLPDPFDSASGFGAGGEGPYDVTITLGEGDDDVYAVRLRKGDVLGTSVSGAASVIGIFDPAGTMVMGSGQDASSIYPIQSPLPGGGNAVADHVVDENGWYYVGVSGGDGDYDVTVEAYRPRLDTDRPVQTLFIDFDGARVNTGIWGGPGVRTLSPLRAFLGRWGLRNRDLDPLIDRIVATVRENVAQDMIASGLNPDFHLRVLNSRDNADPFGRPNVSRVVVGGTIAESGIPTIGIAQSIDPGNYATEETALVLLDVLSDPSVEYGDPSLNTYITPASNRVAFVGRAVGNIVSHEAGHFFGDWHVDQFNDQANLMDQGGNFPLLFAVGPDGIGGTADDPDVDFGEDVLNPGEGFLGYEDTLSRVAFALTQ
jgi:hypothetical protein